MGTAEGTPTYGWSCTFLFRATPRRDPNRTLFVRKPDPRTTDRQALRERPRQDLETLRTNRNANPKSQVGTSGRRSHGSLGRGSGVFPSAPRASQGMAALADRLFANLEWQPAATAMRSCSSSRRWGGSVLPGRACRDRNEPLLDDDQPRRSRCRSCLPVIAGVWWAGAVARVAVAVQARQCAGRSERPPMRRVGQPRRALSKVVPSPAG